MPEGEAGVAARNMVKAMLGQMSFEFNASTRQVVFKVGAEVAENGSYKVTAVKGDTVTVDIEGEVSDLVVKNNTLAVSDGEGTFLLFDKRQ
jgi:hypothetical protein